MHKHVEWDTPGTQSVQSYYAKDPNDYVEPHPGSIVSGRYRGANVRVRVEAYRDATSIGEVVALIDNSGERLKQLGDLSLGDIVRLPDDKRAFETSSADEDDD
ncbi:hypothetical protein MHM84_09210 [Halomonas sp. McH1-25]|uniref:hypothetical protein n=1 Tax=unclassified Halomonas TaxID=2609666 RepID=UPI001EF4D9F3|nr:MULTISPECIES: hypothetical protein [unclassified Halomonas]MCG7599966.1 hypothetical protein [Halomonas sp. McH1-25]MCP1343377.1 hypothetical protein [Halomonas sp. FL8]MCP1360466.1 hypothetical protein [Halomonas sp. BBD45]MCP1363858.1 hypothetical protein [Halomonas sp. BBD48]